MRTCVHKAFFVRNTREFKCYDLLINQFIYLPLWFYYTTLQGKCRNKGGYLAEINSETENTFLKEQIILNKLTAGN